MCVGPSNFNVNTANHLIEAVKGFSNSALLAFSVSDFQLSLPALTIIIDTILVARMRLPFASSFRDYVLRELKDDAPCNSLCVNHATSQSVLHLKLHHLQSALTATKIRAGDSCYPQVSCEGAN